MAAPGTIATLMFGYFFHTFAFTVVVAVTGFSVVTGGEDADPEPEATEEAAAEAAAEAADPEPEAVDAAAEAADPEPEAAVDAAVDAAVEAVAFALGTRP